MDSSFKDIIFDYNPLRELVAIGVSALPSCTNPVDGVHLGRPAGRGISDTDLVGCVTSLDAVVSQGCLVRVPGRKTFAPRGQD